jgi:hypothetical protein
MAQSTPDDSMGRDQWKRSRWSADKKDGDGGSWEARSRTRRMAWSEKSDKKDGDGDGH